VRRTRLTRFVLILLLIEFLDEFVFGAREAAWPLIRDDLGLTYAQIGLLLAVPDIIANIIEPFLAVLGDVWRRRVIVLGGGLVFTAALALTAASASFGMLMLSFIALYPASGAFVSLSQATLMDLDPARREHNMARWTFAGSVGVVLGPLALGVGVSLALGWRGVMGLMAGLSLALVLLGFTMPYPGGDPEARFSVRTVFKGVRDAVLSVRRPGVLRWLVLLQFSDLMLDVLLGFLALYLVDVGAATPAQASLAVAVWTGVGLLGDFALIPLLERVRGLRYLRVSALLELALFPAMLLAPEFWQKLVLLGLIGLFNAGWYAILQAQLYAALPGQSGTALAVKNVSGMVGALIPLTLGLVAQRWGLDVAMWLLLAGPIALVIGLAGQRSEVTVED
jgi:FSR family fosmidomycin resistance protein-like MFS transporter